ncbi:MAG: tRNA (adenosine(37)-N6)-threonylcarbamoyltransferase complex dimerization subunit type 1 TsaB [Alphaproteobacteria bacterium]|nr:tRNA (adenosine(37)-N6)-threonylcarbamoyltransferase complex dimerization subunit type 1 TsaB [Alphaproteobacteria bacterium]
MYTIVFDTSASGCNIALIKGTEIISSFSKLMDFGQSELLMPEIKNILEQNSIDFDCLSALFVCVGPGSFTGVRSSISAARVFAFAKPNLKVGGISAFDAYINTFKEQEVADINAVIIETRREDFYVQFFDKHLQKISEPEAMMRDKIIEILKNKGCMVSIIGDGVERFLSSPSGLCLHSIKMFDTLPITSLAKAGLKMLQDKKLNYPKPLYLRAPDITLPKA